MNIPIIAENTLDTFSIKNKLQTNGHNVTVANNKYNFEILKIKLFDAVITDIFAFKKSPLRVIREARQACTEIKIIAVNSSTEHKMPFYTDVALLLGADYAVVNTEDHNLLLNYLKCKKRVEFSTL